MAALIRDRLVRKSDIAISSSGLEHRRNTRQP
jgi:hypothetical protein